MVNHSCLFKNPPPWIVALAPLLIFMGFLGSGFFPLFLVTSTVLILSTAFFTISKHKAVQPVHDDENLYEEDQKAVLTTPVNLEDGSKPQHDENHQTKEANDHDHDHIIASKGSSAGCDLSESDQDQCLDQHSSTSEDSEVGDDQSPDYYSDGSISDEESLIEIALPSGHYVGHNYYKEEHTNLMSTSLHQKVPDLLPAADTIFGQRSLMELLAEINEMNEEENLIEIDISIGSIKCSRFEIEA